MKNIFLVTLILFLSGCGKDTLSVQVLPGNIGSKLNTPHSLMDEITSFDFFNVITTAGFCNQKPFTAGILAPPEATQYFVDPKTLYWKTNVKVSPTYGSTELTNIANALNSPLAVIDNSLSFNVKTNETLPIAMYTYAMWGGPNGQFCQPNIPATESDDFIASFVSGKFLLDAKHGPQVTMPLAIAKMKTMITRTGLSVASVPDMTTEYGRELFMLVTVKLQAAFIPVRLSVSLDSSLPNAIASNSFLPIWTFVSNTSIPKSFLPASPTSSFATFVIPKVFPMSFEVVSSTSQTFRVQCGRSVSFRRFSEPALPYPAMDHLLVELIDADPANNLCGVNLI